jgi:predicted amidohydrolase
LTGNYIVDRNYDEGSLEFRLLFFILYAECRKNFQIFVLLIFRMIKISVIQCDIKWEDKEANFLKLENLITPLQDQTDIVILPEMFSTGFSMSAEHLSEPEDGKTLQWMIRMAVKGKFAICGSYIVKENEKFFNRFVFVSPDSAYSYYDKRHLFSMGEEDRWFSPGHERLVFSYKEFRISPYVCYDLRFPVWSRNRNEYDLAIYSANWPETRINVWNVLLQARAIENQCYVAGCNRIGKDGMGIGYNGFSQIINPRGGIIKSAGINEECVITSEISLTELNNFRQKFNTLKDADNFEVSV